MPAYPLSMAWPTGKRHSRYAARKSREAARALCGLHGPRDRHSPDIWLDRDGGAGVGRLDIHRCFQSITR